MYAISRLNLAAVFPISAKPVLDAGPGSHTGWDFFFSPVTLGKHLLHRHLQCLSWRWRCWMAVIFPLFMLWFLVLRVWLGLRSWHLCHRCHWRKCCETRWRAFPGLAASSIVLAVTATCSTFGFLFVRYCPTLSFHLLGAICLPSGPSNYKHVSKSPYRVLSARSPVT